MENKELLKTGDILLCRSHSLLSKLIRKATKSHWSHTAHVVDIWGEMYVVEAQISGVDPKSWDNWVKKYNYEWVAIRNPRMGDEREFCKRSFSLVGVTGYDLVTFLIRHPWRIITGSWRNQKNDNKKMICSQYTAWCHSLPDSARLVPDDVARYAKEKNWDEITMSV